jgi:RNA polymerase sigma factor (TIGR02999 family)
MDEITQILNAIDQGDRQAVDDLLPLIYQQLRHMATQKLAHESPGQTLQPTALVHEAYLRLVGSSGSSFESRAHFFSAAAEAMRRILVDNARRKKRIRHGGRLRRIPLDDSHATSAAPSVDLLALDEALEKLADVDQEKADLVKLKFFGGLTNAQAAQTLGISPSVASRHWAYARVWLMREMRQASDSSCT